MGKIIHQPPKGIGRARGIEVPNDEKNPRRGADSRGEEVHHRIRENHRERRRRRKRGKSQTIARPPANRLFTIRPMNSSKDQRGIDGRRKIRIDLGGPFPAEVNELSLGQRLGRFGWTRRIWNSQSRRRSDAHEWFFGFLEILKARGRHGGKPSNASHHDAGGFFHVRQTNFTPHAAFDGGVKARQQDRNRLDLVLQRERFGRRIVDQQGAPTSQGRSR